MKVFLRMCILFISMVVGIIVLTDAAPRPNVIEKASHPPASPTKVEVIYKITYPTPPSWVSPKYITYVMQECYRQGVPYLLVFKLIERESEWKASARNYNKDPKTGKIISIDYNRFQINSLNFEKFIKLYKDPDRKASSYDLANDVYDNAQIGIRHLADLYHEFGNWCLAVQAYNGGSYRIKTQGPRPETLTYQQYIVPVENWWHFPANVIIIREDHSS